MSTDEERMIAEECDALRELLVSKNRAYGNSALDPLRVFSRAGPEEQIRVRLDDKLSRLARGQAAGEDVEIDLMGYLVLLRVARRMSRSTAEKIEPAQSLDGESAAAEEKSEEPLSLLERLRERCAQECDYEEASADLMLRDSSFPKYAGKHIRQIDVQAWVRSGCPDRLPLRPRRG